MSKTQRASLFLVEGGAVAGVVILAVCCLLLWLNPAPAQTLAPPCTGEGDAWRCFDVAPAYLAETFVTLEFECYDVAGAKVVLLQLENGEASRYRILARQIDGCKPGG